MSLLLIVNVYFLTDDSTTSSKDNHNDTLGELDDVNCHPILDDPSHPLLDGVNCHPILDDSSYPVLDGVNCHPILDDSSHPLLDGVNWSPNEPKKLVISFSITLNRVLLPAA